MGFFSKLWNAITGKTKTPDPEPDLNWHLDSKGVWREKPPNEELPWNRYYGDTPPTDWEGFLPIREQHDYYNNDWSATERSMYDKFIGDYLGPRKNQDYEKLFDIGYLDQNVSTADRIAARKELEFRMGTEYQWYPEQQQNGTEFWVMWDEWYVS